MTPDLVARQVDTVRLYHTRDELAVRCCRRTLTWCDDELVSLCPYPHKLDIVLRDISALLIVIWHR